MNRLFYSVVFQTIIMLFFRQKENKKTSQNERFFCWPTRTRTLNDGTKNRSVTITPWANNQRYHCDCGCKYRTYFIQCKFLHKKILKK